jgi:hypothetical protein
MLIIRPTETRWEMMVKDWIVAEFSNPDLFFILVTQVHAFFQVMPV